MEAPPVSVFGTVPDQTKSHLGGPHQCHAEDGSPTGIQKKAMSLLRPSLIPHNCPTRYRPSGPQREVGATGERSVLYLRHFDRLQNETRGLWQWASATLAH